MQIWLKSKGYTVSEINIYPTITAAITVITTLIYAWTSDTVFRGARWPPILFSGVTLIIAYTSLAVWHIPDNWKWACFFLLGVGGGISGLTFAWAHEICKEDNEERALVTGTMNELAYVFQAWLPLLVWQQVEAPKYRKGYITMVAVDAGMIGCAFLIRYLHSRDTRRKEADSEVLHQGIEA
jgi:ACS family pantothenate transporter-like MFS transporter